MTDRELFDAARELSDPAAREQFLTEACKEDLPQLQRLRELLTAHAAAGRFLEPDATTDHRPDAADKPTETFHAAHSIGDVQTVTGDGGHSGPAGSAASHELGMVIAGRYKLTAAIGEGGMGSVYLAEQSEPVKRQVALKLIKSGTDSKKVLARFEAERQALALMDHPNIARVYDGGTTATGQPFFVMELVQGVPITQFCDQKRLPPRERLELFVQVCRAVQHAHQKGIIHRDLKPGNILVTEVDGRPTPKVIDFGVAKATEFQLTDRSLADQGAIVGTPAYMSPEQADPSKADIDTRTDVYALGVVLYELLAGLPPISPSEFRQRAVLEMLRMVREMTPEHLSTKASSAEGLPNIAASRGLEPTQLLSFLRGDVDWIVLKALEKDRERRYESANGMAADILRYLANEPVVARPPSRAYRLKKFVRRNRGAVLAASLIALALMGGIAGIVWQWREAVYQRAQADKARDEAQNNYRIAQEQRKVALDTLGRMVTTVRAEMSTRPDLQGTVTTLLRIARESLDNIIQNPSVDISLNDTTRALIHDLRARTLRDGGDTPAALAEFNKAAETFQTIIDKAADGPDKEIVRKNLVIVLLSLGQATLRTGSQAEARDYFDRAAAILGQLDNKTAKDYRRVLMQLYMSMGKVTVDKKPREARQNYQSAMTIAQEIAKQETAEKGKPSDEANLALLQLHQLMSSAEGRLRNAKASEEHLTKSQTIAAALLAALPTDNGRKRQLAFSHERLGDLLLRSNRAPAAALEYATAALLLKAIAESDPKNVDAQADHARILYSQGLAAERGGDKPAAAKFHQQSLDIRKMRVNLKTETYAQKDLMVSLARVGSHREAVELAETVRAKLAKDPGTLVDVANCYAICSAGNDNRDLYRTKALEALKQALDAGYGDKVNLETEPDLDAVRDHAEFKALLNRLPEP